MRTSIPDVSLSDIADPKKAELVFAFRDEVARDVRPAEFSDLKGLILGLSTGIQSELDKLAEQAADQVGAGTPSRSCLAVYASPRIGHSAPGIWDLGSLIEGLAPGHGAGPAPHPAGR